MKAVLTAIFVVGSVLPAFASPKPLAAGTVEIFNGANALEVVIDGPAAEKLYKTLKVPAKQHSYWLNKAADGIVCGQNMKDMTYSCSFGVGEAGIQ